jgi:hypothetical protein
MRASSDTSEAMQYQIATTKIRKEATGTNKGDHLCTCHMKLVEVEHITG